MSASRGIFAMARDRRIPSMLAVTSRRYDSPLGATVFLLGASLVTLALDGWWKGPFALSATPHYFALFAWGSYVNGTVIPVDGSASAVDVGTLPFDPRVQVRRYDGS